MLEEEAGEAELKLARQRRRVPDTIQDCLEIESGVGDSAGGDSGGLGVCTAAIDKAVWKMERRV